MELRPRRSIYARGRRRSYLRESARDADKLKVCEVSDGVAIHQVVCGAANARPGVKVPFARVGAVLGDDFKFSELIFVALSLVVCCVVPMNSDYLMSVLV